MGLGIVVVPGDGVASVRYQGFGYKNRWLCWRWGWIGFDLDRLRGHRRSLLMTLRKVR